MDKFLALTEEKRLTILNAALQCFGKFGYEKASINDVKSNSTFTCWNTARKS